MSDREAFEKHCPMPKGLVFNASLNRYDGGVYTSALSYNDMWCAWQHAWQAALQHSGEAVVNEPTFIDLTLEEIEGIIKSNITITDYRLYEGVYAVATDIETALKNKNSSAGKETV